MNISKQSLDEQLKEHYDRWNYLYAHGGQDPFYSDGCNLNLVRNHIIHTKRRMEEAEELTETYYRELPPEVGMDYMARTDEIRANARRSLEIYKKHEDYLYLCNAFKSLNKQQINETCIQNVLGYVTGLEKYIKDDDLVSMRRHEHAERYTDSFISCRKRTDEILSSKPKMAFHNDGRQLEGQLSMADLWG